jgi:hypothetical protein
VTNLPSVRLEPMKTNLLLSLLLVTSLAFAQHDHTLELNKRGDHEMGFSHEKTTHHFELNQDGGVIDVRRMI